MRREHFKAWERGKTALIVLLMLSAVYLLGQSQLYIDLGLENGPAWVRRLTGFFLPGQSTRQEGGAQWENELLQLKPARIMVCNEEGRYGVQYDAQTVGEEFDQWLGPILGEALAAAGSGASSTEEAWRRALEETNAAICYDFLGELPLEGLSLWINGEKNRALTGSARRILLMREESGAARILTQASGGGFWTSPLPGGMAERLDAAAARYAPNDACFAFQQGERYRDLDPYVMLLPDPPTAIVYTAFDPLDEEKAGKEGRDGLLSSLLFHPQASAVYRSVDGLVIREGKDTLRIRSGGEVSFDGRDSSEPRYQIGERATLEEMVEYVYLLMARSAGSLSGEAGVCYLGAETRETGGMALRFGYTLNGAPVQMTDTGYAALFIVEEGCISEFTIRFRGYQAESEGEQPLLPEFQAMAAMEALGLAGGELTVCYRDGGQSRLTPSWTAMKQAG